MQPYLSGPEGVQEILPTPHGSVPVPAKQEQDRTEGGILWTGDQVTQLLQLACVHHMKAGFL